MAFPNDPTASERKKDHIELALRSRVDAAALDGRFYYEPMLAAHPVPDTHTYPFMGIRMRTPFWVSSMTGGTAMAGHINRNLARACGEFGMGMGLGSCRQLLYDDTFFADFDVRDLLGPELPFYANLGVAQVEMLLEKNEINRVSDLLMRLRADGLIVHVNPLQEAMQPEGDMFKKTPLETIEALLDQLDAKIIVKEVGQGFGPESMRALLQLPLEALDFAAAGGTNFAKLELLRSDPERGTTFGPLVNVGHTAADMIGWLRNAYGELGNRCHTKNIIISGGIRDFLDGYYGVQQSPLPAVYGQASAFLTYAQGDYEDLRAYVRSQLHGYQLAEAFLRVR